MLRGAQQWQHPMGSEHRSLLEVKDGATGRRSASRILPLSSVLYAARVLHFVMKEAGLLCKTSLCLLDRG